MHQGNTKIKDKGQSVRNVHLRNTAQKVKCLLLINHARLEDTAPKDLGIYLKFVKKATTVLQIHQLQYLVLQDSIARNKALLHLQEAVLRVIFVLVKLLKIIHLMERLVKYVHKVITVKLGRHRKLHVQQILT